jgi:hypothetical protein
MREGNFECGWQAGRNVTNFGMLCQAPIGEAIDSLDRSYMIWRSSVTNRNTGPAASPVGTESERTITKYIVLISPP